MASLDAEACNLVKNTFIENGVEVITEVAVNALEGCDDSNDVCAAALNTGEIITCETVFVTIGIRPRIEIVEGSGIEVRKGILVDRHMKTNIDDIYAAGDIAEAYDPLIGIERVIPILPNAYIGGRVAGFNMTGNKNAEYNVGMSVNSVNFFGKPFMSAGFSTQEEGDGFRVINKHDENGYRKMVIRDGKLVGMIITGAVERAGLLTGIMRSGINVEGMENQLLDGNVGLICLPDEVKKERILGTGRNWL